MHPRYFIGLSLPDDITRGIEASRNPFINEPNLLQPLVPHITLLHPGILTAVSPMFLVPKVKEISKKFLPLEVSLTKIGMFDQRVIYIKVSCPKLHELQNALVSALPEHIRSSYNFGKDFVPHVTIAQAEPRQSINKEIISQLQDSLGRLLPYTFESQNISVFRQLKPREYKVSELA